MKNIPKKKVKYIGPGNKWRVTIRKGKKKTQKTGTIQECWAVSKTLGCR